MISILRMIMLLPYTILPDKRLLKKPGSLADAGYTATKVCCVCHGEALFEAKLLCSVDDLMQT
jgi:hypothetical protein